jgi:hypothetical protein
MLFGIGAALGVAYWRNLGFMPESSIPIVLVIWALSLAIVFLVGRKFGAGNYQVQMQFQQQAQSQNVYLVNGGAQVPASAGAGAPLEVAVRDVLQVSTALALDSGRAPPDDAYSLPPPPRQAMVLPSSGAREQRRRSLDVPGAHQ